MAFLQSALSFVLRRMPRQEVRLLNFLMRRSLPPAMGVFLKKGITVGTVYDVGARTGDWTAEAARLFPGADFVLFEANPDFGAALARTGHRHFIALLFSEEREVDFYSRGSEGDSIFRENTSGFDDLEPTRVQAATLDGLIERENLPLPDFLKIDTQGAEIEVMKGGSKALAAARFVLLECPVMSAFNQGAPNFDEYQTFMLEAGFLPTNLIERHVIDGRLLQVDILFAKKTLINQVFGDTVLKD